MVKGSRFVCSSYVKYQETVSSRPEDPLLSFLTTAIVVDTVSNTVEACDDLRAEYSAPLGCTYGSCGEGSTLVCLNEGEQCQSGIPVPSSVTRRSLAGRECPTGKVIELGAQVGGGLKSFQGSQVVRWNRGQDDSSTNASIPRRISRAVSCSKVNPSSSVTNVSRHPPGGGCMYPDLRFGGSTVSGQFGTDCSTIVS